MWIIYDIWRKIAGTGFWACWVAWTCGHCRMKSHRCSRWWEALGRSPKTLWLLVGWREVAVGWAPKPLRLLIGSGTPKTLRFLIESGTPKALWLLLVRSSKEQEQQ